MSVILNSPNSPDVSRSLQLDGLLEPVAAFVSRCGKRIRQTLVQSSYEIAGGLQEAPDCLASAIEMLHAGSLVIDDIQDGSMERRSQPTMHRQIGTPLAINAGNWMYFDALDQVSQSELSPSLRRRVVAKMITAGKCCHEGQAIDLSARIDQLPPSCFESVAMEISRKKTGCLVSLATQLGGMAAMRGKASEGDRSLVRSLAKFGTEIGVALQMRNDLDELLSLVRDPYDQIRSDDLRNARVTWPWAWVAQLSSTQEIRGLIEQTVSAQNDPAMLAPIARRLLDRVYRAGDRIIERRISRQLKTLRSLSRDSTAIDTLAAGLRCISQPVDRLAISSSPATISTESCHVDRV